MKKIVSGICGMLVALGIFQAVQAGNGSFSTPCSPSENILCGSYKPACKPKKSLWDFGLWAEAGIFANEYGQTNAYDWKGDVEDYSGNTFLLSNVWQSDFQMNQLWVYGEKKLSGRGFDVGGRVDFGFGTDMKFLQSDNLERNNLRGDGSLKPWRTGDYYTALPQLYGEVGYNNLSLKVGKFLSTFGYESIMAPERFFYSICHVYRHRPATQTGAIFIWDVSDKFSVYGGWVNGMNMSFETSRDNAFLGGVDWKVSECVKLGYSVMVGVETGNRMVGDYSHHRDYFIQSFYADLKLTRRFNYVFEWTVHSSSRWEEYDILGNLVQRSDNLGVYGINNEFFYTLNDRWKLGIRAEWLHTYGDAGDTWVNSGKTDDVFSFTVALNWKPTRRLTFKPEIRYDVCDNGTPFNMTKSGIPDSKGSQLSGGVSMVVQF